MRGLGCMATTVEALLSPVGVAARRREMSPPFPLDILGVGSCFPRAWGMGAAREATTGPSSPCWAVGGNLALRAGGDGMVELPRGTVTFLLTDVEGSSALWEAAPDAMHAALTRHDLLFEETVRAHRGVHVRPRGEGDSRFAVFASAVGAVAAAVTFQRALASEAWLLPRPLAVRIGIHTGHAELRDGDYYGSAVNRCARVRDVGRGTQTILSDATVAVVRDDL